MPAEKPATTKSSENRRSNKPIMEKRRRARINSCLNDLKALILEALKKDPARHSKLEKADILEMTVKHLQNLQRQQMALSTATDPNVVNKFRAGFNECANEVTRFLNRMDALDQSVQQRLMGHLANCLSGIGATGAAAAGSMQPQQPQSQPATYHLGNLAAAALPSGIIAGTPTSTATVKSSSTPPMTALPNGVQPLSIHVLPPPNAASSIFASSSPHGPGSDNKVESSSVMSPSTARVVKGLQFVPTRLPSGDIALLLPANYAAIPLGHVASVAQNSTSSAATSILSPLTINTCSAATTVEGESRKSVITPPLTPISGVGRLEQIRDPRRERSPPEFTTAILSTPTPLTVNSPTFTSSSVSATTTSPSKGSDLMSPPPSHWSTATPPLRELAANTEALHGSSRSFRQPYPLTASGRYSFENVKSHSDLPPVYKEIKNGPWRPW